MIDAQNLMGVGNLYQSTNRNQNCYPKKGAQKLMGPTKIKGTKIRGVKIKGVRKFDPHQRGKLA